MTALLLIAPLAVLAQNQGPSNINIAMMEATCKIVGDGSTGTGFILASPGANDSGFGYPVLVTAQHVLEDVQGDSVILVLRNVVDRDKQEYRRFPVSIEIRENGTALWSEHTDVDLAAMIVDLPRNLNIQAISTNFLFTDEKIKDFELSPGTELFCLGYPFGKESTPVGFPILRSGKIASYPILPTAHTKSFLFDFTIFPGNSGGPVYIYKIAPFSKGGKTQLVGRMQGILGIVTQETILTETTEQFYEKRETRTPIALAKVIHASFIRDLISKMPLPTKEQSQPSIERTR